MGKLIYAANTSLDGYLEDESGSFDWSEPDDEVHAFWNEHERGIGTSLYGRRMYEVMRVWETDDWLATASAVVREYAGIWRDADKIVYSSTLDEVSTARTRIERGGGSTPQGDVRHRPERRRRGTRGRGVPARAGGRVRPSPLPGGRGRREARAAQRPPGGPRAAGPPTLRERRPLRAPRGPERDLTTGRRRA